MDYIIFISFKFIIFHIFKNINKITYIYYNNLISIDFISPVNRYFITGLYEKYLDLLFIHNHYFNIQRWNIRDHIHIL